MSPKPSSPRAAAVSLLDEITGEGQLMSDLTERRAFQRLAAQDRAAAQRLATQTLRGLERADRILDRLCCAAALARRDEAAILDRLLDLMEPDDIVNFHRTTRRRRDEPVPPLRVRARPEVAQHLIRARA